jgi:outer membrane scaffolding protein for murein synthesis (MipA/OmpV family)
MKNKLFLLALALSLPIPAGADDIGTLLGAAVRTRPQYDGSDRQTTDLIPVIRYYGPVLFARTTQGFLEGGARKELGKGVYAGAQIGYEVGPRDGDPGASAGAHLEWDTNIGPAPVFFLARYRAHLDSDRGQHVDARVSAGVYDRGGMLLVLFGQATFASEKHLQEYYGVADSGLLYSSFGLLGSYDLTRQWLLVFGAEARRLGSAADGSAFVQDRTNYYANAGITYRF